MVRFRLRIYRVEEEKKVKLLGLSLDEYCFLLKFKGFRSELSEECV